MEDISVITVSREFGSQGEESSEELSKELGFLLYSLGRGTSSHL
jgi:hypothetical protein